MRALRTAACLALMLALTSCSMSYPVTAWFRDGKLVFFIDGEDFEGRCWKHFKILGDGGQPSWSVGRGNCSQGVLVYGQAPNRAEVETRPKPLKLGKIYVIDGYSDNGGLHGAFYLYEGGGQRTVQNLSNDDPRAQSIRNASYKGHQAYVTE